MPKTGFHTWGPLNVKIIKEDNSSVFTADERLGGAKKKIFNWFFTVYPHLFTMDIRQ